MSASSDALTECSWMPRRCATAATPAVRQLARPERTSSTGVGALSSAAKTCGWSASTVNIFFRDCSAPSPKKLLITERLCVPISHSQLARHLNCAASGTCSKDSRALSSALTLTPLSAFARGEMLVVVVIVSVSCAVSSCFNHACVFEDQAAPQGVGIHCSPLSERHTFTLLEVMSDAVTLASSFSPLNWDSHFATAAPMAQPYPVGAQRNHAPVEVPLAKSEGPDDPRLFRVDAHTDRKLDLRALKSYVLELRVAHRAKVGDRSLLTAPIEV